MQLMVTVRPSPAMIDFAKTRLAMGNLQNPIAAIVIAGMNCQDYLFKPAQPDYSVSVGFQVTTRRPPIVCNTAVKAALCSEMK